VLRWRHLPSKVRGCSRFAAAGACAARYFVFWALLGFPHCASALLTPLLRLLQLPLALPQGKMATFTARLTGLGNPFSVRGVPVDATPEHVLELTERTPSGAALRITVATCTLWRRGVDGSKVELNAQQPLSASPGETLEFIVERVAVPDAGEPPRPGHWARWAWVGLHLCSRTAAHTATRISPSLVLRFPAAPGPAPLPNDRVILALLQQMQQASAAQLQRMQNDAAAAAAASAAQLQQLRNDGAAAAAAATTQHEDLAKLGEECAVAVVPSATVPFVPSPHAHPQLTDLYVSHSLATQCRSPAAGQDSTRTTRQRFFLSSHSSPTSASLAGCAASWACEVGAPHVLGGLWALAR